MLGLANRCPWPLLLSQPIKVIGGSPGIRGSDPGSLASVSF